MLHLIARLALPNYLLLFTSMSDVLYNRHVKNHYPRPLNQSIS